MAEHSDPFPNWSTGEHERQIAKRFGITKATCTENGDGWKDSGRIGDVAFAYGREMRAPYGAGQFMCVGNPISSVSVSTHSFERPTFRDLWNLRKKIINDLRHERRRLKLMFGPHRSFQSKKVV